MNREWPQNVVTPSTRDLNRNVCPIHSNARRIEKCLKKHGLLADTPSSCRLMSAQRMCQKVGVNAIDPLSWKKECVYGLCKDCPKHNTTVETHLQETPVTVALWGTKFDPLKNKKINNIHDFDFTLGELAAKFDSDIPKLSKHIYTSSHQWEACKKCAQSLQKNWCMTIEDYQENITVTNVEETTTAHFSRNQVQLALYPVVVRFVLEGEDRVRKGALAFLS